jgi:TIR domain/Pentapeptide repeats (8 copies)
VVKDEERGHNVMANQEQLDILKQGVYTWNQWRKEHPNIDPDLSSATLTEAKLSGADLRSADLSYTDLSYTDLSYANLSEANLWGANLSGASLFVTNFNGTDLRNADLSHAYIGWVTFGDVDLRPVKGLDTIAHGEPSTIGTNTLERSEGDIPEVFLRGTGLSDTFIEYAHSLTSRAIEYYTCFISYSSKDHAFVERLYTDLQAKGVRCWYALEDMRIGDKIRPRIDESIRRYDKLLLVLSKYSVASEWVEFEVETALAKERKEKKTVLFPIRLDETIMESTTAWAAHIQNTRHVGDFTRWKNHDSYQKAFDRLLRDLKASSGDVGK